MPALLQAFVRLVVLKRLGVLLFVLAATLCASSNASALEPTQTKTRVWGFDLAANNSNGLFRAATSGKHQGNRAALSEVASGSLLAAEGAAALEGTALRAESSLSGSLLRQQLAAEEIAGAELPSSISSYSRHALNQAISRDGVGVSTGAIRDAFQSPLQIAGEAGGKFHFIGQNATVVVNSQGNIVTLWAESSAGWRMVP